MTASTETAYPWKSYQGDPQKLHQFGVALTSQLTESEVMHAIMEQVEAAFKPDCWSLLLFDEEHNQLRVELIVGVKTQALQGVWLGVDGHAIGQVFQKQQLQVLPGDLAGPIAFGDETITATKGMLVPVGFENRGMGVLCLFDGDVSADPTGQLEGQVLADYIAIAIRNARLQQSVRKLSVTDDVTSLYNARYLEQALEQEYSRSRRAGTPISVIFLDLDYFKLVNDRNGHLVGSEVLKETANILRQNLRATDIATRYGGDEFVLVLPETDKEEALLVAQRCRDAMRIHKFGVRHGFDGKVTGSFGIATLPDDTQDKMDLIRLADQAMYYVKEKSRDDIATVAEMRAANG